jgi:lon-related putative ATP-dependent protease
MSGQCPSARVRWTRRAYARLVDQFRVPPEKLRRRLDPASLPFKSTEELTAHEGPLNQERAMEALRFGIGIDSPGYNLFVTGVSGSGRTSMVRAYLEQIAAGRPAPEDWVYVHNFEQPDSPSALRLPAGKGRELAADMDLFITQARREIGRAFETERYAERRLQLAGERAQLREPVLNELEKFARERAFGVEVTQSGIATVPMRDGRPMTPDELEHLPEPERSDLERRGTEVQTEIGRIMRRLSQLEREGAEQLARLDREIASFALEPLLHDLRERYGQQPEVVAHLERIAEDIPNHLADVRRPAGQAEPASPFEAAFSVDHTDRYRVNVLIDNSGLSGAPVKVETNPTYYNLIGRVEYRATLGMMVTDFRQVKSGALHRSNGGFLILEAADVLTNPFAWAALVRSLSTRQVRIENLGEQYSALPTASLSPAPVPIRLKVVLVGTPLLYQMLFQMDEEFRELFKVRVDFAPEVEWTEESNTAYASFVRRCINERNLIHFDSGAVAEVIEEAARWRESQRKLSTRLRDLDDLVTEASYWGQQAGRALVAAGDVRKAVAEKSRRSSLAEERLREMITEGTIRVEVTGSRVGQLNGLSVIELGDHCFGTPSRISATVGLGRGSVESIERETELGGPIHNKGFLIVSGYLASRYAQKWPLALHATLTFEQSYGEVEGDSASSAELYALLSALAEVPLNQSMAVTGSVDQHGNVQAIGGVTDKIEGFFRVCKTMGLTGEQGVIIPTTNVSDLMLDEEVIDAVRAGQFHVWAVDSADQGIEVLTGLPAGERQPDGGFPEGSIHALVAARLEGYALVQAAFGATHNGESRVRKAPAKKAPA